MGEEKIDLAAKDVFVLLRVPVPENLESGSKWQEKDDTINDDSESQLTFDEIDKTDVKPYVDVTPTEDLDNSSSDSLTTNEIEEKRWYNPLSVADLGKSDFNSLKSLLNAIKNTDPTNTRAALSKLNNNIRSDEPFQNMFITLNGFEVLINILECKNNEDCMKEALIIIQGMSEYYGNQCSLCNLDAVRPLLNILLLNKNVTLQHLAMSTLFNISKLRKGRKLIRISSGIPIIVDIMRKSKNVLSIEMENLNKVNQTIARLVSSCSMTMAFLCRSLKSQEDLWNTGFIIQFLPQLLQTKHIIVQESIMNLVKNCCRPSENAVSQKMNLLYKEVLKELKLIPQILQFMESDTINLAMNAAETILSIIDDDSCVYDILLNHKGMEVIFRAIQKSKQEPNLIVLIMRVLWKSSLNTQCRQVIEKNSMIVNYLHDLLSYQSDDHVIGYAVGILSELWKSDSMRPQLKLTALPRLLEILQTSLHSMILTHVYNVLSIVCCDPECLMLINEINGFQLVFISITSWDIKNFLDYQDFDQSEMIIAAVKCLVEIIKNTPLAVNNLKGMYRSIRDVVELLTHENLDVIAAVCQLIEVIVLFDENLKIMINVGVIENLAKLVLTLQDHTNLKANLCRALGKCCANGRVVSRLCSQNIVSQLLKYTESEHQIVRENVVLALNGLSSSALHCDIMNSPAIVSFLKEATKSSNNMEIRAAAIHCLNNIKKFH